ncbi:hypothetical protein H6G80_30240 [Nostoc sp. FACHB-87]|uniref:hypothetical protein n=1 Tax=Nostocaceae TaxID=1162 RepID=UPI0016894D33|nr:MULTISPECIES: hypothetical protein [Nostocaceae]MBD2458334.1 hypothetical protein [Nostoc sp. FACHB-87]MBD2479355.1 hypothetical protein [Anabaena sp. FACHB-83]
MTSSTPGKKRSLDRTTATPDFYTKDGALPPKRSRKQSAPIEEQTQPNISISICTWNINHITPASESLREKCASIDYILTKFLPDLLVLQEVNQPFGFSDFPKKIGDKVYKVTWGPHLETTDTEYTGKKLGLQNEYYAAFYSNEIEILETFVIQNSLKIGRGKSQPDRPEYGIFERKPEETSLKEKEKITWVYHRPVVMRKLKKTGKTFLLGIVHTSPSYKVEESARDYIWGATQIAGNDLWILAGDWYVQETGEKETPNIPLPSPPNKKWKDFLADNRCILVKPKRTTYQGVLPKVTNFPHNGNGMIADYFVTSNHLKNMDCILLGHEKDQNSEYSKREKNTVPGSGWPSDHAPVLATFEIQPISASQSLFPHHEYGFTVAMSDEPVLLNGMKVIFDQPVGVYPVNLESKEEARRNGT